MATPGSEATWLWIGTIGMVLGTVYFAVRGRGSTDPEQQTYYIITTLIPAIAAAAYLAMATGLGVISMPIRGTEVIDIYWARYADWLLTTPLLIIDLALVAGARKQTLYKLIIIDAIMILGGLAGSMMQQGAVIRIVWWAVSTAAFIILLYYLLGELSERARSRSAETGIIFNRLRNITLGLWALYPIVWILGTGGGFGIIAVTTEIMLYVMLDIGTKIGFGAVLLGSQDILQAASHPSSTNDIKSH
ncbi:bacteriorhodopsin [Haloquadratum walsbyi]|uniref:Bacteriorhodopsin II n=1 Tax=Haloquadratum walsbyi (strain DSM 16854 / JCM 12705 / C23) TaxID=768065 RepID=G0LFY1_HALWC|nr:bacteriorhodopsin [Haloquadratum walsbyi]CCC39001.1 bacteriorhodopsin II [Haloquadratum walsbyi C23]